MSADNPIESDPDNLTERLRAATELLEQIAADRTLLSAVAGEERSRLVQAAGQVYCPTPAERRRLVKANKRVRKNTKKAADDSVLDETGIRKLRRQRVKGSKGAVLVIDN